MHLFECKWIWLKSRTTTHNLHKSDLGPLFFESNAESSGLWIGTLWGPKSNIMVIHQNISFDPHRNGWSTSAASRQNNTGLTNITQIYPLTKGCICLNSISFLCSGSTKITQQGWDMVFIWFSSINWFNQVQENVVYLSFRGVCCGLTCAGVSKSRQMKWLGSETKAILLQAEGRHSKKRSNLSCLTKNLLFSKGGQLFS